MKKPKNKLSLVCVVLAALGFSESSYATRPEVRTEVIQSGRDEDVLEINKDAVEKIDRVMDLLGISRPPHIVEFMPSYDLARLASLGRPAVGHWRDGSVIATQASRTLGVLEFVTPGDPTCRSFYSDHVTPAHQIEVIKHVGGHNDMAVNSVYSKIRPHNDPVAAAEELYEFIEKTSAVEDMDEVAQWYQYLMSLENAQDLARGTFESPEKYIRQHQVGKRVIKHPASPTPHELQFLVHNLPSDLPKWKKDFIEIFERMERVMGEYTSTKIMNEGWAIFVQDLMAPYLPWTDDHNLIEAASLKAAVAVEKLSNPYWLGRSAWQNLYKRFYRDQKASMTLSGDARLVIDRKFVEYAHGLMKTLGDYGFLRLALNDQEWVSRYHLYLHRKASDTEQDQALQPPQAERPQEQKLVVSVLPSDVADWIAKRFADRTLQYPTVRVEDSSATGSNVYSLSHEVIGGIPLERESAAQALYVRTQILAKPVSLKTVALSSWTVPLKPPASWRGGFMGPMPWGSQRKEEKLKLVPIRVQVEPDGTARAYVIEEIKEEVKGEAGAEATATDSDDEDSTPKTREVLNERLTASYQKAVTQFREELVGVVGEKLEREQEKRFEPLLRRVTTQMALPALAPPSVPTAATMSHAISSGLAVERYLDMIQRRLHAAMKRMLKAKKMRKTQTGVKVRVLPTIPSFELDQYARTALEKSEGESALATQSSVSAAPAFLTAWFAPKAPLYSGYSTQIHLGGRLALSSSKTEGPVQVPSIFADTLGGGSSGTPGEGDIVWGDAEDPNKGGNGDSEAADGEEQDSDEQGEEPGNKPGEGGGNPSDVDVSFDVLAEFLKEEIELPRIRPKGGTAQLIESQRDGVQRRPFGDIQWVRTAGGAMGYGLAHQRKEAEAAREAGRIPVSLSKKDLLKSGMKYLQPGDWFVPDRELVRVPDMRAVVVIWMDMTGSMYGKPIQMAKEFMFNLKLLLSTKYKNIEFKYIGFADTARLFDNEKQFFSTFINGGTNYAVGIQKAREVLEGYNRSQWDRYAFGIGDAEDGNPAESSRELEQLTQETEYSAFVETFVGGYPNPQFVQTVERLASQEDSYFGFGILSPDSDSPVEVLKKILGKNKD